RPHGVATSSTTGEARAIPRHRSAHTGSPCHGDVTVLEDEEIAALPDDEATAAAVVRHAEPLPFALRQPALPRREQECVERELLHAASNDTRGLARTEEARRRPERVGAGRGSRRDGPGTGLQLETN